MTHLTRASHIYLAVRPVGVSILLLGCVGVRHRPRVPVSECVANVSRLAVKAGIIAPLVVPRSDIIQLFDDS